MLRLPEFVPESPPDGDRFIPASQDIHEAFINDLNEHTKKFTLDKQDKGYVFEVCCLNKTDFVTHIYNVSDDQWRRATRVFG